MPRQPSKTENAAFLLDGTQPTISFNVKSTQYLSSNRINAFRFNNHKVFP
jgi:hypothetical protein